MKLRRGLVWGEMHEAVFTLMQGDGLQESSATSADLSTAHQTNGDWPHAAEAVDWLSQTERRLGKRLR